MAQSREKGKGGGGCGWRSWILATILYNGLFYVLLTLLLRSADEGNPIACTVELAGFKGLPPPALTTTTTSSPGPEATATATTSPAFELVVRVSNGYASGVLSHGGGDVVVSYAGVPLARGRTPALELGSREVATMAPVEAGGVGVGVGVPGDLSRLMAAERRWGTAQLQIELAFASDSFVCDVLLDAPQRRVFDCYSPSY